MRKTTRGTKRLCKSLSSRTRFSCLILSLLLVAVFATSLFMLPRPSVASSSNDGAIVIEGNTVIIQGNTTTTDIRTSMQSAAGKNTDTVLFKNSITIQTLQTGSSNAPFADATWLKYVKADEGAQVAFAPASPQTDPTLTYFFYNCSGLTSLDGLSAWDVGNVTGDDCMYYMFFGCSGLTSLDGLSAWNVGNVTGDWCMGGMLSGCSGLTSLDGLSAWDVSKVTGDYCMCYMFYGCRGLTSLDGLSVWNVGNVTGHDCMYYMFYNCSGLTSLDGLSAWNVSNVAGTNCMQCMFGYCSGLTSLDGLSAWDVSNVAGDECMSLMFQDCSGLTSLDAIASWNIDGAIASTDGVYNMFTGCDNIASITLGGAGGFKLDSAMSLPSANWWPVGYAGIAVDFSTAALITESTQVSPSCLRWQKCASGRDYPLQTVTSLNVVWPKTNAEKRELIYNGLFQTLGTKDNKVQVVASIKGQEPVTLTEGKDFYVVYKDASGKDSVAIKDVGDYSARIVLRGAYCGSDSNTIDVSICLAHSGSKDFVRILPESLRQQKRIGIYTQFCNSHNV